MKSCLEHLDQKDVPWWARSGLRSWLQGGRLHYRVSHGHSQTLSFQAREGRREKGNRRKKKDNEREEGKEKRRKETKDFFTRRKQLF